MGLLRMLKYVLGTEDETQQPRQTQSSAKNANNAKPARTGQTKQTGQVARRVTQPQLQPHATSIATPSIAATPIATACKAHPATAVASRPHRQGA